MFPVGNALSISSHGGIVIPTQFSVNADGLPVLCVNDLHVCPIEGHGVTPITDFTTTTADGRQVACVGTAMADCGAIIVTGAFDVMAD